MHTDVSDYTILQFSVVTFPIAIPAFLPRDAILAVIVCPSVCLSVCLSVRLSQVGVVQRWLNLGSD